MYIGVDRVHAYRVRPLILEIQPPCAVIGGVQKYNPMMQSAG